MEITVSIPWLDGFKVSAPALQSTYIGSRLWKSVGALNIKSNPGFAQPLMIQQAVENILPKVEISVFLNLWIATKVLFFHFIRKYG